MNIYEHLWKHMKIGENRWTSVNNLWTFVKNNRTSLKNLRKFMNIDEQSLKLSEKQRNQLKKLQVSMNKLWKPSRNTANLSKINETAQETTFLKWFLPVFAKPEHLPILISMVVAKPEPEKPFSISGFWWFLLGRGPRNNFPVFQWNKVLKKCSKVLKSIKKWQKVLKSVKQCYKSAQKPFLHQAALLAAPPLSQRRAAVRRATARRAARSPPGRGGSPCAARAQFFKKEKVFFSYLFEQKQNTLGHVAPAICRLSDQAVCGGSWMHRAKCSAEVFKNCEQVFTNGVMSGVKHVFKSVERWYKSIQKC
jgi:hypothetical protein